MECILTFYVLIDRAKPLSINVYNNWVVSMIQGPYFVKERRKANALIHFSELSKILTERKFKSDKIDNIWNLCWRQIIIMILSIWDKFSQEKLTSNPRSHNFMSVRFLKFTV